MRKFICNCCGKDLDEYDMLHNMKEIKPRYSINVDYITYGSEFDGNRVQLDMCANCFDNLINSCKISPLV